MRSIWRLEAARKQRGYQTLGEREAFDDWVTSKVAIKLSDECEAFGGWKLRVSNVASTLRLKLSFGESLSFHLVAGVGFEPTTFGL